MDRGEGPGSLFQLHLTLGTLAMLAGSFLEECGEQVVRPLLAEGGGNRDAMEIIINNRPVTTAAKAPEFGINSGRRTFPKSRISRNRDLLDGLKLP